MCPAVKRSLVARQIDSFLADILVAYIKKTVAPPYKDKAIQTVYSSMKEIDHKPGIHHKPSDPFDFWNNKAYTNFPGLQNTRFNFDSILKKITNDICSYIKSELIFKLFDLCALMRNDKNMYCDRQGVPSEVALMKHVSHIRNAANTLYNCIQKVESREAFINQKNAMGLDDELIMRTFNLRDPSQTWSDEEICQHTGAVKGFPLLADSQNLPVFINCLRAALIKTFPNFSLKAKEETNDADFF